MVYWSVMKGKQPRLPQHLFMAVFAVALVLWGWQLWEMASAHAGRAATLLGWFGVVACGVNLGGLVWFYAKRWFSPARRRGGVE